MERNAHESPLARGLCFSAFDFTRQAYNARMRPLPAAPDVPGDTPAERLSNALNRVLRVSKADLLKEEARQRRGSEKTRAKRKRGS